jgi:hypothetical protein
MAVLELEYQGDDLIISREMAEKELGLQPGDRLEIRPKLMLEQLDRSDEEVAQIKADFEALRQSFDEANLDDWEMTRKAVWATWQPPT